jgi:hypothetical protein
MPAVQQTVKNYLGGVSTQPDFKKKPDQVKEATNVWIDPAFGLTKRPGSEFIRDIGTEDEFKDCHFFFYNRDQTEQYFCAVKAGSLRVFNALGVEATVTIEDDSLDYLTSNNHFDYRTLSIQDKTFILNRTIKVTEEPLPVFKRNRNGTVVIKAVEYAAQYKVNINGTVCSITTADASSDEGINVNVDKILDDLKAKIDSQNLPVSVTKLDISLELVSTNDIKFTLSGSGGRNNDALETFQDFVRDASEVPNVSIAGRTIKVENSASEDDDYYLTYDGTADKWVESIAPDASPGLTDSTMPHELISTAANEFTFRKVDWIKRLVGDMNTNPSPSFVDNKINNLLFNNNRLGFLSGPNVVMSRTSAYENFFAKSALTQIDDDPIDLNTNSTIPSNLVHSLPVPQGVLLFSNRQQFLMTADQNIFTPTTTFIRQISNYEVDEDISPVDLGTYQVFVQKTLGYVKVMIMQIPDVNQPPNVVDISKVVAEWIPPNIDRLYTSPVNEVVMLSSRENNDVYFYRKYNTGSDELMQSWFKWQMPGKTLFYVVPEDTVLFVSTQANKTAFNSVPLDKSLALPVVHSTEDAYSNPFIDFWSVGTVGTWDQATKTQKVYVPFDHIDGLQPLLVTTQDAPQTIEQFGTSPPNTYGWILDCKKDTDGNYIYGTDATGNYYVFDRNLTELTEEIIVGYRYAYSVTFPEQYFKDKEGSSDYTSFLNVSRLKFAVGLTGALEFKLQTKGRDEWSPIYPVIEADYYSANTGPLKHRYFFTVPIHQRSTNFMIKAYSDVPFPVAINMMTWEGMYSPRFYKRT